MSISVCTFALSSAGATHMICIDRESERGRGTKRWGRELLNPCPLYYWKGNTAFFCIKKWTFLYTCMYNCVLSVCPWESVRVRVSEQCACVYRGSVELISKPKGFFYVQYVLTCRANHIFHLSSETFFWAPQPQTSNCRQMSSIHFKTVRSFLFFWWENDL